MRDDDGEEYDESGSDRALSRLAQRLDLPEIYVTRDAARRAGFEAAGRFAAGQLSADRYELKTRQGDYQLIGGAGVPA